MLCSGGAVAQNYPLLLTAAHISNTELEPLEEDPNLTQLSFALDQMNDDSDAPLYDSTR